MHRYQGPATLEWWSNPLTCLGSFRVSLTVSAAGDGWRGVAVPDPDRSDRAREGFDFLLLVDPVFTLRFPDDRTVPVAVTAEDGHLVLGPVEDGGRGGHRV
ncbi:hypothetical protein ACIRPK_21600 [Kitasatospora sp. NPDC101801]|uniref:hypothetical protein n=1 Tax=Kitasatospora sp. NPDC101801 TaxID=3364103 RepID=UPI0037FEE6F6